jgi:hypothetical protein
MWIVGRLIPTIDGPVAMDGSVCMTKSPTTTATIPIQTSNRVTAPRLISGVGTGTPPLYPHIRADLQ